MAAHENKEGQGSAASHHYPNADEIFKYAKHNGFPRAVCWRVDHRSLINEKAAIK